MPVPMAESQVVHLVHLFLVQSNPGGHPESPGASACPKSCDSDSGEGRDCASPQDGHHTSPNPSAKSSPSSSANMYNWKLWCRPCWWIWLWRFDSLIISSRAFIFHNARSVFW